MNKNKISIRNDYMFLDEVGTISMGYSLDFEIKTRRIISRAMDLTDMRYNFPNPLSADEVISLLESFADDANFPVILSLGSQRIVNTAGSLLKRLTANGAFGVLRYKTQADIKWTPAQATNDSFVPVGDRRKNNKGEIQILHLTLTPLRQAAALTD